ncbi:MAG: DUF4386 family protein [bacterium]|nr:DUF4386 family protein [bacterium]
MTLTPGQPYSDKAAEIVDLRWKGLFTSGGMAAFFYVGFHDRTDHRFRYLAPPTTVASYFSLFHESWLLGLLSLDLLYIVDSVLLIFIYLAVYLVLRRAGESAMLIALVFGIVGIAAYFASNTAFEMLSLSHQSAAATSEAQGATFLTSGQVMLETYKGTAFDIYYVLNTIVLFIFSSVMLRSQLFSKATAYLGFLAGILMIVPSTAGTLGLYFSLASLVPWAIWLVLVGKQLLRFGSQ